MRFGPNLFWRSSATEADADRQRPVDPSIVLNRRRRDRITRAVCATVALLILGTLLPPIGGLIAYVSPDSATAQTRRELGPAPIVTDPAELAQTVFTEPRAYAAAINTLDRQAVVNAYNAILPAFSVPAGWTGSIAGCNPGTTSAAYEAATLQAVNYYRAMASLPNVGPFDATFNSKNAQSALMTIAQGQLDHFPTASFACFTAGGAEAAGKSNLAIGAAGPDAIDLYMDDFGAGNTAVGHRRWILFPPQVTLGTGSNSGVNGFFHGANSLWVIGTFGARPASPEFVAWPPVGFVPRQVTYDRWSFSLPNASFAGATISMTKNGAPVTVNVLSVQNGFGDNTVVWEPQGLTHPAGMADTTYHVTVNNVVVGGTPRTFNYDVVVIDPATTAVVTPTPTVPVAATVGGKGLSISAGPTGAVNETWEPGTAQLGYLLLRLDFVSGGAALVPPSGISAAQTSFSDTTFTAPGGVYCYVLLPNTSAGLLRSDMLCVFRNSRSASGSPENFTLRLNQSNTASLSWNAPIGGGQTGYSLNLLTAAAPPPVPLGAATTSANVPIAGTTCFRLDATGRGSSDVLCAFTGVSNL